MAEPRKESIFGSLPYTVETQWKLIFLIREWIPATKAKANEFLMSSLAFMMKLLETNFMPPDCLAPNIAHVFNWKNCKYYALVKGVKETIPDELKKPYIKDLKAEGVAKIPVRVSPSKKTPASSRYLHVSLRHLF